MALHLFRRVAQGVFGLVQFGQCSLDAGHRGNNAAHLAVRQGGNGARA